MFKENELDDKTREFVIFRGDVEPIEALGLDETNPFIHVSFATENQMRYYDVTSTPVTHLGQKTIPQLQITMANKFVTEHIDE